MNRLVTIALCLGSAAFAQSDDHAAQAKPQRFFRMQVRVDQFDGNKLFKSQEVSATLPFGTQGTHIRAGEKIPSGEHYIDAGLNVDFRDLEEVPSGLALSLRLEISAAINADAAKLPLIREYRWDSNVLVPVGKPALIFADTDSSSQYKMEVKVTATPLDVR